jgi:excinuclease ABC subunit C
MEQIPFDPADPRAALSQLPHASAVFALYGADAHAEPYIGRTPNLRARLERLLQPSPKHPRRLQLAGRVRRIAYRLTGSEFESLLTQFSLLEETFGAKTLERMHLRMPAFVRYLGGNPYPRIVVTNRPSLREAAWSYGPFPSRAAAERYAEEALKLFLLRRCTDDLNPDPSHPGCVYSEMKMCLAPCYKGCTDARYAEEAAAVQEFFSTRGESHLVTLRTQREHASATLAFESAAQIHTQVQRVESVRALASELVRPLSRLRAVILQASSQPGEISVFLFEDGRLRGPAAFSTLGMRIQNEQSGSTSLFAQPMALEPVPEEQVSGFRSAEGEMRFSEEQGTEDEGPREQGTKGEQDSPGAAEVLKGHDFSRAGSLAKKERASAPEGALQSPTIPRGLLESRLESVLAELAAPAAAPSATLRQGHLALLKRWYYRPEARRAGEIFFPDAEGAWPVKAILRGAGRVAAKMLAPAGPP